MMGRRQRKRPRGRVLKVKQGYNPNSSSMGSIVFVLPAVMLGVTIVAGAVMGALAPMMESMFLRLWRRRQDRLVRKKIQ